MSTKEDSPPALFHDVCERWAQGAATAFDNAVLLSLTMNHPLPSMYNPVLVGFDPHTRLPPAHFVHLFHDVKNEIRLQFHCDKTDKSVATVHTALLCGSPQARSGSSVAASLSASFPSTLASAPALLGLRSAALSALGAKRGVQWCVPLSVIENAGLSFVTAAHNAGWSSTIDVDGCAGDVKDDPLKSDTVVRWSCAKDTPDKTFAHLAVRIAHALPPASSDVIPAGQTFYMEDRPLSARAPFLVRLSLRFYISVGTSRPLSRLSAIRKWAFRSASRKNDCYFCP